jgi:hypothetical protein
VERYDTIYRKECRHTEIYRREGKGSEKLDLWGILGYFQALVRFIIGPDAFVIPAPVFTRVNSGGNPCFSEL